MPTNGESQLERLQQAGLIKDSASDDDLHAVDEHLDPELAELLVYVKSRLDKFDQARDSGPFTTWLLF